MQSNSVQAHSGSQGQRSDQRNRWHRQRITDDDPTADLESIRTLCSPVKGHRNRRRVRWNASGRANRRSIRFVGTRADAGTRRVDRALRTAEER